MPLFNGKHRLYNIIIICYNSLLQNLKGIDILRLLILFLLLFIYSLNASIVLTDETKKVDNFALSYFYDDSQLLNIEQISQKEFTQTTRSAFSFGYVDGTTWYKLTLTNESQNEHYVLSFLEAFSDGLNLHREKNGVFTKSESGLLVPLDKREIHDSNPTFMLNIKSGETKTYYVEAFSKFSSAGELVIYEQNTYLSEGKPFYIAIYMFYFGSLVIVMLFNSFLYITIKDKIFAYYAAYIFFYALFILVLSGFDLYLGFEHLHEEFHVVSPLVMVFLTLFSSYFLQTKQFYPKLYKVLMANVLIYAILVPLVFISVEPWIEVVNAITTFTFILLIYIAILTSRKGYSLAIYYLFIMLIYIFSLILMTSVLLGDIENNNFNRYIFMFASYLEIILFSVILAKIYNTTKSQADRDPLTGLYNRRYFSNEADKSLALSKKHKQSFCILMIDIDYFKSINDTYGHDTGDKILIQLSYKLVELSRAQDIVSRHGGEEFIMLLPDTTTTEATIIANRIREGIEDMEIITDSEKVINITVSIGVSQSVLDDNVGIEKIILDADMNLYQAKEAGRNKVYSV
jgi:diguanylate cyclase (GGDEF)-like protein